MFVIRRDKWKRTSDLSNCPADNRTQQFQIFFINVLGVHKFRPFYNGLGLSKELSCIKICDEINGNICNE